MCNRRLEIRIAGSFGYPRWIYIYIYIYIFKEKAGITKGFTENRSEKKKIKEDPDITKGSYRKILS